MLTFNPDSKWEELPVPFVSQAKALPGNFASCGEWISRPWNTYAGRGDNRQRIAFYGLRTLEISDEIKFAIHPNTETLAEIDEARAGFNEVIRDYRKLSNDGSKPPLFLNWRRNTKKNAFRGCRRRNLPRQDFEQVRTERGLEG